MTFELCFEGREGFSHADSWGKSFLSKGSSQCKSPQEEQPVLSE